MKKFNFEKNRKEIFSIRKLNVGVIPLAIMSLAVFGVATSSQELKASNNQTAENNKVESITQSIDNKNGLENSLEPKKRSKRALVDSSVITDFNATVTLRNDATVMNAGDTKNLSAQEVAFEKIEMTFKIKQDGTLKAGDTIRIPVTLTNNAYGGYYANLSSGTSEPIQGVGTIKFDSSNPNNLAYVITLNSDFANIPANTEKTVTVTQRAANGSKFTAKSSKKDIVLDINGKVFTFKPVAREFPKAEAIFSVYNSASTDRANSIKIGTSVGAANYYNNMLSSNGQNPGNNTKIPDGDIISIHHVKPAAGSTIIGIKPDNKRYTSTLAISEDGKYLVNKDTPTSIIIDSDPDNKVIEMPANSSNEDILKALQKAGKNSSVVINNGDGTYTLGINLGKMKGEGITTYHDLRPTDDYAEFGDTYQEIDRTPEVNKQVSKILKDMSVIQGTGHSTRIIFADSSIKNSIEGSKSYSYSVDGNGVGTQLRTDDIKATTTPSNARAVGQTKITVRYVDTEGKEIETQDYRYGYPAGLATTPKSPNYDVKPKNIDNYTLITETTTVPGVAGTQLTTNKSIEFKSDDQNVYYVYKIKEGIAKVKYIDDTTNEVLEVKDDLKGKYNTKSTYTIDDTVKKYTDKNYEFVSSTYPTDGVTFGKEEQVFEVHLKHKTEKAPESKKVKQTINYVYKDNNPSEPAFPTVERELEFTRENTKDLVTNVVTNGQWTPANGTSFGEVVSPTKPGYTADKAKVEEVNNVTEDTADIVETVVYSPETQKLTYTVIDDTTNTTLEDKKDLASGDSNSDVKPETQTTYDNIVASYEAKGYELVRKDALPTKFDTDTTVDQNVTIHLKHKTEVTQESKKVKQTINYVYKDNNPAEPAFPTVERELEFTRENTKDLVTNVVTNGQWTPANGTSFGEVVSPTKPGYTADKAKVEAVNNVTGDTADIVETVVYSPETQKLTYTVIDDTTNTTLEDKKDLASGDSNSEVKPETQTTYDNIVASYEAKGYELVRKDVLPTKFDTDTTVDQNVTIHLKHKTEVTQESKKVKQTINYVYKDNNPAEPAFPTVERELEFTRENTKDLVTNVVTNGQWTPANGTSFGEVVSPTKPGYTADKAKVEEVNNVTEDTADIVETVVYSPETQKLTYTVIDDTTNTTLEDKKDLASGDSNSDVKPETQTTYDNIVASYEAKGYELVRKDALPTKFDTDTTVDQNVTIHLKHKTEVTQESKKVKQTINYVYKDNNPAEPAFPTVERELGFTRENKRDLVTNVVTNGQWTATNGTVFTEVISPTKPGYTADKAKVEEVNNVTEDTADIVETVVYSPETQKLTYTVIDDTTNTTLEDKKDLASGDSNSEVKPETQTTYDNIVASYEAKGYELVRKDALPTKFDTDTTVDQNVTIHLKHKTEAVKEEKKVSLTVRYHGAGDKTPPNHVEEAVWTRTVTKDKVTGEIIDNGTWISDKSKYAEVTSPVIEGYTADILVVATETVTQDNIVKDVNYTAKPQKPSNPETPGNPDPKTPENPSGNKDKQKALPSTGLNNTNNLTILGLLSIITAFGIRIIKKKH